MVVKVSWRVEPDVGVGIDQNHDRVARLPPAVELSAVQLDYKHLICKGWKTATDTYNNEA